MVVVLCQYAPHSLTGPITAHGRISTEFENCNVQLMSFELTPVHLYIYIYV